MARRAQDDGLIGEALDGMLDVSRQVPVVGLIIAGVFAAGGWYLTRVVPQAMFGFGVIVGYLCYAMATVFGLVGAAGMIRGRLDRRRRLDRLDRARSREDLMGMNWREFEQLIADLYRRRGYRVREVGGSGDGGVDLVLVDEGGVEHLVQCKQYRVWNVSEPKVREFYGAMAAHQTRCQGIFVTCGTFTAPARQFAVGKPLQLIDGDQLVELLRQTNPVAPAVEHFAQAVRLSAPPGTVVPQAGDSDVTPLATPACPVCGAPMLRRTAGRGKHAGQPFWGCSTFPRCRGRRTV